jgi:phenylpropionate dioxygenase-like ring-hydroxylating dioxygenase large terminal subunit
MLAADDNRTLTHTGRGTPMGELFRRFWQPVVLSCELPAPHSPPVRVTVMGEDLVAFRDTEGRVGLVDPRCPHRGADLFFGRNEVCGLRCAYHVPASHRFVTKKLQQCNWAQSVEGGLDASHFSFLHMPAPSLASDVNPDSPAGEQRLRWIREDPLPVFSFADHEVGFVYGAARRAGEGRRSWRTAQFMLPNHATTRSPQPGETYYGYTFVPIQDDSCWIYTYAWNPERPLDDVERQKLPHGYNVVGEVDERYVPLRNRDNGYGQDREDQKHRTFTGVRGIAEQDAMVQESQGGIADRTREHLTAGDAAIVRFRRAVLQSARALADGVEPAAARNPDVYTRRSGRDGTGAEVPFADVMVKRCGDATGRIST